MANNHPAQTDCDNYFITKAGFHLSGQLLNIQDRFIEQHKASSLPFRVRRESTELFGYFPMVWRFISTPLSTLTQYNLQLSCQHIDRIFTPAKSLNKLFIDHAFENPARHSL